MSSNIECCCEIKCWSFSRKWMCEPTKRAWEEEGCYCLYLKDLTSLWHGQRQFLCAWAQVFLWIVCVVSASCFISRNCLQTKIPGKKKNSADDLPWQSFPVTMLRSFDTFSQHLESINQLCCFADCRVTTTWLLCTYVEMSLALNYCRNSTLTSDVCRDKYCPFSRDAWKYKQHSFQKRRNCHSFH